jgi:hypothetical protein
LYPGVELRFLPTAKKEAKKKKLPGLAARRSSLPKLVGVVRWFRSGPMVWWLRGIRPGEVDRQIDTEYDPASSTSGPEYGILTMPTDGGRRDKPAWKGVFSSLGVTQQL